MKLRLTLVFLLLLLVMVEPSRANCPSGSEFCFYAENLPDNRTTRAHLEGRCREVEGGSWPLEVYDPRVQGHLGRFLASLGAQFSGRSVIMNAERTGREEWSHIGAAASGGGGGADFSISSRPDTRTLRRTTLQRFPNQRATATTTRTTTTTTTTPSSIKTTPNNNNRPTGSQEPPPPPPPPTADDLPHLEDVAYLDSKQIKLETGWFNYFDLPYVCSHVPSTSASGCGTTANSLSLGGRCFAAHVTPKRWLDAQNECFRRNGSLALVDSDQLVLLSGWLDRFSKAEQEGLWWVGLAWRPLKWRMKGTLVAWTHFQESLQMKKIPAEIHFQINEDGNRWKISREADAPLAVVCMKVNNNNNCKGDTCRREQQTNSSCNGGMCSQEQPSDAFQSNRHLLSILLGVALVVIVALCVSGVVYVKMKRRGGGGGGGRGGDRGRDESRDKHLAADAWFRYKGLPAAAATVKYDQPIYLQPLPEIYEKPSDPADENNYERLVA